MMPLQRPESAPACPELGGVGYPDRYAALAALRGMRHGPAGLRPKKCRSCPYWHLRARNDLPRKHRRRGLPRLPAGPGSRVAVTTRLEGSEGKGRPVSGSLGVLGTGRPQDVQERRSEGSRRGER